MSSSIEIIDNNIDYNLKYFKMSLKELIDKKVFKDIFSYNEEKDTYYLNLHNAEKKVSQREYNQWDERNTDKTMFYISSFDDFIKIDIEQEYQDHYYPFKVGDLVELNFERSYSGDRALIGYISFKNDFDFILPNKYENKVETFKLIAEKRYYFKIQYKQFCISFD